MIKTLFEYVPFAFVILTMLAVVVPARIGVRAQAIAAMVLLAAFSKFFCFASFGGDAFAPDLPEKTIWIWNGLYSAAVIFMALGCAWLIMLQVFRLHAAGRHFSGSVRVRRAVLMVLAVVSVGLAARGVWNGIKPPVVREVELAVADLPASLEGYRILHLSDLHISSAARRARTLEVVRRANAAGADLIVVTGDLVDGDPSAREADVEPLRRLNAPDGVWFATGNHEFYFDWFGWRALYDLWGLKFLRNECVFPRPELALGGVDDEAISRVAPGAYPSLMSAFAASTNGAFRVLLCHRPKCFPNAARAFGVRLQLSGHTHGGIMPLLDRFVARHNSGFVRGISRDGDSILAISSGAGQWAGFPIRFFNDPEIPLYILRRNAP